MTQVIRILVVDDHAVVREGLRAFIGGKPDMELVGEAADGEEAVLLARSLQPDVILLDLVMPGKTGIQAIQEIRQENSEARILVLTSFGEDDQVFSAVKAGALGYLLKDSSPQELLEAIRCVYRGQSSLHPAVARKLILGYGQDQPSRSGNGCLDRTRSGGAETGSARIPPKQAASSKTGHLPILLG